MAGTGEADKDTNFNVYTAGQNGVLKGVYFGAESEAPLLKNFHTFHNMTKCPSEVRGLSWMDPTQRDLLLTFSSHLLKIYNTKLRAFTQGIQLQGLDKSSSMVGIFTHRNMDQSVGDSFVVGVESGQVTMWNFLTDQNTLQFSVGSHLARLSPCPSSNSVFATGGKENDLKVWDLGGSDPTQPLFKAKALPHDFLDLKIPLWIQDIKFLPQSQDLISLCTRHGFLRLYDTKVDNRNRPVMNLNFTDHALMTIATTRHDKQIVVGSSQGQMALIDLRFPDPSHVVRTYVGPAGSVREIVAHPDLPYFVSCSLDRHLYLHHLEGKRPIKKLFLKTKLNCVLMSDAFLIPNSPNNPPPHPPLPTTVWQNINSEILTHGTPLIKTKHKRMKLGSGD